MPADLRNMFDCARQMVLEILPGSEYETWNELCGDRSITELLDFIERGLVNAGRRPREGLRYLCAYGGDVRVEVQRRANNSSEQVARGELERLAREEGTADSGPEQRIDADQVLRELEKETAERKGDVDALQQVIGILIPPDFRIIFDCGRRRILEEVPGYESWRALRGERSINELVDVIDQGLVDGTMPFRPPIDTLKYFCAYGGDVQHKRGRLQQERRDNRFTVSYDEEQRILDELDLFVLEQIHWMLQQGAQD
ncbi:hypothetical protein BJ138DRAFT_1150078 [Hygrophoropsis aurantiaca]|uniref:Uncharacterized protein n=1 Tax=Hygrophoropsis aurantiaca TaxID=72124 RepID=A0ACB8AEC2_9AGAM|nr:hypothetical protein BJ138DRAFT_1150078 [Hygrophoropsis aurantiaca]